jgi:regulator of protease activity HflC (stomatin/prohibitin superfamily)
MMLFTENELNILLWAGVSVVMLVILNGSIRFVPQNRTYLVERFGKYSRTLSAGLNFTIPLLEKVAYNRTLKEQAIDVASQAAITRDNITLTVDGVLYLKILDPYLASYGVERYNFAVIQLAQTTMRAEIGRMDLDQTFEQRDTLNANIVSAINQAAEPWGVQVLRYEIRDLVPPETVLQAMEQQMKAEREKRAAILESEGQRQSDINIAEGKKQSLVLTAEADKMEQILRAEGEAQAIRSVAEARAESIQTVGEAAATAEGQKAIQLDLATRAIQAKQHIAKKSTVVLMDEKNSSAANTVAEAIAIVTAMNKSGGFSHG